MKSKLKGDQLRINHIKSNILAIYVHFLNGLILFCFMFTSCVIRENIRPIREFNLGFPISQNIKIQVEYGSSYSYQMDSLTIVKIKLDKLRGGDSKLFGLFTLNEHDPDKEKHIHIKNNNKQSSVDLSYNDVIKLLKINVDSGQVYLLKK